MPNNDPILDNSIYGYKKRLYRVSALMAFSGIFISAVIVSYSNMTSNSEVLIQVYDKIQISLVALMPYMISAAVAAITAIGILTILPSARVIDPVGKLLFRIRGLAMGDLHSSVKITGNSHMKEVARELNIAIGNINSEISELKILNRQQWGLLCEIRMWAENNNCETILMYIQEMERQWDKIAEVEERLMTGS